MILNAQPKQLSLKDDGQILWQADASNPLPGQPVAIIRKGAAQLAPVVELLETDALDGQDRDAVRAYIESWLHDHIKVVLAPLPGLASAEGITGAVKDIAVIVYDAMGIVPRQDIEPMIAALDADGRKTLRQLHVRLGPVLAFVPELNKPAAVKLRGALWWLWNDRALPAPLPKDGVVSVVVDETTVDPVYQRAIGYPVYGGRAIRVDMLDRLISAIYDGAKDGTFKATHAMAEWMGCSIPDLYRIIESMGHKKTHDPAETPAQIPVQQADAAAESADGATVAVVDNDAGSQDVPEAASGSAETTDTPAKVETAKPELATFRLKRGKAHESARPPRADRPAFRPRKDDKAGAKDSRDSRDSRDNRADKDRGKKPFKGKGKGKPERAEKKPLSFEARPQQLADSPFAMLEQLKAGMKDK